MIPVLADIGVWILSQHYPGIIPNTGVNLIPLLATGPIFDQKYKSGKVGIQKANE